jgi:hypothetical protein
MYLIALVKIKGQFELIVPLPIRCFDCIAFGVVPSVIAAKTMTVDADAIAISTERHSSWLSVRHKKRVVIANPTSNRSRCLASLVKVLLSIA